MTQQVREGPTELGPDDLDRLARYLATECLPDWNGVAVTGAHRVTGGMSWETFLVDAQDLGGATRGRFVVRRAPPGGPLAPYDIEREARLVRALSQGSQVPVPRVLGLVTDGSVLGRPFAVLEFIAGDAPDLRRIESWDQWSDPASRAELAEEMMSGLAAIQAFDWRRGSLPGSLVDGGTLAERVHARIGHFMERLEREVYPTFAPQPAVRDAAAEWLKEHVPPLESDDLVIVHGDYRFGNLIWQGTKLVAILDWERATIGHPMQDLGFMCMRMARQRNPELMGMVATLDELGTLYEKAAGRPVDLRSVHYFSVLAQFVEAALVPIGLAYACDLDRPPYVVALTVYPQLNAAVRNLVQDIEDYESGRYVL